MPPFDFPRYCGWQVLHKAYLPQPYPSAKCEAHRSSNFLARWRTGSVKGDHISNRSLPSQIIRNGNYSTGVDCRMGGNDLLNLYARNPAPSNFDHIIRAPEHMNSAGGIDHSFIKGAIVPTGFIKIYGRCMDGSILPYPCQAAGGSGRHRTISPKGSFG